MARTISRLFWVLGVFAVIMCTGAVASRAQFEPTPQAASAGTATSTASPRTVPSDNDRDPPPPVRMFRGDLARAGVMPGPDPKGHLGELWRADVDEPIWSSPAFDDGVLYFGTGRLDERRGSVIALDATTGQELWRQRGSPFVSSPAIANGEVFIASLDGFLYALDATNGSVIRRMVPKGGEYCPTGASPAVSDDLVVVTFGCPGPEGADVSVPWTELKGRLVAFNKGTGDRVWVFELPGFEPLSSPAIAGDIVIVASTNDPDYATGTVHAIDIATGQELWRFTSNTGFASTPAIYGDLVFVSGANGQLFALDLATGLERWRFDLGFPTYQSPAIRDGKVYIGNSGGSLFAIDAELGVEDWRAEISMLSNAPPVVTEDSVFVGSEAGFLYRVDRTTGSIEDRDRVAIDSPPLETSPIVTGGVIYLTTDHGLLIALGDLRSTVPIGVGLTVEIVSPTAVLRGAPGTAAVVRAELASGMTASVTGNAEERDGQIWWPIEIPGVGPGWILESALIAAEVPQTPMPGASTATAATPRPPASPTILQATPVEAATMWCADPMFPSAGDSLMASQTTFLREGPAGLSRLLQTLSAGDEMRVRQSTSSRPEVDTAHACEWVPVVVEESGQHGFVLLDQVRMVSVTAFATPESATVEPRTVTGRDDSIEVVVPDVDAMIDEITAQTTDPIRDPNGGDAARRALDDEDEDRGGRESANDKKRKSLRDRIRERTGQSQSPRLNQSGQDQSPVSSDNDNGQLNRDNDAGVCTDPTAPGFPFDCDPEEVALSVTPTAAPVATASGESTPGHDNSAQTMSLLDLLPTQEQVPAGLILTDEAERSKAEVIDSLGESDEAAQLIDDWGWSGNAYRDFVVPEGGELPASGTTLINVSVHRFADAESAANALVFLSDQVILGQGLREVEAPAIGESARLLLGTPVAVLYVQDGPFLYRVGASSSNSESDPSEDVLSVARTIEADPSAFMPTHEVSTLTAVNLRSGPSVDASVVTSLEPRTALESLDETAPSSDPETRLPWLKVRTESGQIGWIPGDLIRETEARARETSPTPQVVAAEATISAQATQIAALQSQQTNAQVTATALAVVAASSVLDPNQQSISIQTDLNGMLSGNQNALDATRGELQRILSRYPVGCRAGFVLISGNAPSIEQGIELAERVEALLRQERSDIFTEETGFEQFAQPNVEPYGQVTTQIFFYSGCQPIG